MYVCVRARGKISQKDIKMTEYNSYQNTHLLIKPLIYYTINEIYDEQFETILMFEFFQPSRSIN